MYKCLKNFKRETLRNLIHKWYYKANGKHTNLYCQHYCKKLTSYSKLTCDISYFIKFGVVCILIFYRICLMMTNKVENTCSKGNAISCLVPKCST
jgi:hypothetical protein